MINAGLQDLLSIRNVQNFQNLRINGRLSTTNVNTAETSDCAKNEVTLRKVGLIQVSNSTYCAGVNQNLKAVVYNVAAPTFPIADHFQFRNKKRTALDGSNVKYDSKQASLISLPLDKGGSVYTVQHKNSVSYVGTVISSNDNLFGNNSLQYKSVTVINNVASANNGTIPSGINDVLEKSAKRQTVKRKLQSLLEPSKKRVNNHKCVIDRSSFNVVHYGNQISSIDDLNSSCKVDSIVEEQVYNNVIYSNQRSKPSKTKPRNLINSTVIYPQLITAATQSDSAKSTSSKRDEIATSTKFRFIPSPSTSTVNGIQVCNTYDKSKTVPINSEATDRIAASKLQTDSRGDDYDELNGSLVVKPDSVTNNRIINKRKSVEDTNIPVRRIRTKLKLIHSLEYKTAINTEINNDIPNNKSIKNSPPDANEPTTSNEQCSSEDGMLKYDDDSSTIETDDIVVKCENDKVVNPLEEIGKYKSKNENADDVEPKQKEKEEISVSSECENEAEKKKWKMANGTRHEVLQRIDDEFEEIKNIHCDLLPLTGTEITDSKIDINEEEAVIFQKSSFPSSFRSEYENINRRTKVDRLRDDIFRQIRQLENSKKSFPTFSRGYMRSVVEAAKEYPSDTATILYSQLEKNDLSRINIASVKQNCCIKDCSNTSLPCSRYCIEHILQCKHQVLLEKCSAVLDEDDSVCNKPVLNIYNNPVTCSLHCRSNNRKQTENSHTVTGTSTISATSALLEDTQQKNDPVAVPHEISNISSSQLSEVMMKNDFPIDSPAKMVNCNDVVGVSDDGILNEINEVSVEKPVVTSSCSNTIPKEEDVKINNILITSDVKSVKQLPNCKTTTKCNKKNNIAIVVMKKPSSSAVTNNTSRVKSKTMIKRTPLSLPTKILQTDRKIVNTYIDHKYSNNNNNDDDNNSHNKSDSIINEKIEFKTGNTENTGCLNNLYVQITKKHVSSMNGHLESLYEKPNMEFNNVVDNQDLSQYIHFEDADEIEVTNDVANAEFPLTSAKLENQDLTQYEDVAKTSNEDKDKKCKETEQLESTIQIVENGIEDLMTSSQNEIDPSLVLEEYCDDYNEDVTLPFFFNTSKTLRQT